MKNYQRKTQSEGSLFSCSSFSFHLFILTVKAVRSHVKTLSPTAILMLEVSCQSARHGRLHFYSAAVLAVLPISVTVSCFVTNFSSSSVALQIFSTS